jgi:hypothetical protein
VKRALTIGGVALLAVITFARVRLIDALPDQGYFAKYIVFADRILSGQIPRDRLLDLSPLYLWFVVAMRAVGADFHAIRTFQIVLVSVAALLVGIAARRWGTIAMIAAPIFLLGSRAALVCATEVEPETLILVFNAAALALLFEGRRYTYAGFFLGLSAVCRPVALLAAGALAALHRSWRILAATAIPVVIILGVNFALTHEIALMDPGTVFYEGMNPNAGGYEGVQPRIVNDLERQSQDPDYLHVAYRVVASRAAGRPLSRAESNRYWTSKALAFVRAYPAAALRLVARKAFFALHSYDAYDLATMARKDFALARLLFIPFGALVALAVVAMILRVHDIAPAVVFAAAIYVTLIAFYVTARQRNALLPAMCILAAAGLAEIINRRHLGALIAAGVIGIFLSINGNAQHEDAAGWLGARNGFDYAIALEDAGRWREADAILQRLEQAKYRPMRENRAVSSIAYYRARAAMRMGQARAPVLQLLDRAEAEAPGNEHVLALRAVLGDRRAERLLFELHDPLTARRSLSVAAAAPGRR